MRLELLSVQVKQAAKTNQVHERGRGTLRAAKPTAEYIHEKARTEDEADGRLQDKTNTLTKIQPLSKCTERANPEVYLKVQTFDES